MKKLLSLVVAALLVLSMLPMGAMAEAAQKALPNTRTETIKRADEGLKAPEAPSNRAMSLADALNAEDSYINLDFETEGAYPWTMLEEEGRAYGQSSNAGVSSSSSTVTATFTLDAECVLSFDYKAWGEGNSTIYDKCIFMLDGTAVFTKGAEQNNWTTYSVADVLFAGEHTIEFTYSKDSSVNSSGDYFAIDEVKLTVAADVTPTPAPTPVPDDYVGYFFETQDDVDAWLFVDNDGDGKNWTWAQMETYRPAYEGSGCMYSASYEGNALHPDNWAISPGMTVAGADSYVSLYMGPRNGNSYYAEHVAVYIADGVELNSYEPVAEFTFTSGGYKYYEYSLADYVGETVYLAIRHYNCTDQYEVRLDQVEFFGVEEQGAAPTPEPPTPTPAPTEVPEDMVGYYFETDEDVAEWLFIDADGDGHNWDRRDSVDYAYEGVGCITSASYDNNIGVLHPDNWALSPTQTVLNADAYFSFYIAPQDPNWPAEHIGVYIGSGTDTRDYVMIDEFTLDSGNYVQMSYSLADYVGEEINAALRHFDCTDQFMVNVDMFVFVGVEEGEPLPKPDPTPGPTEVPEDMVGYYFETDADVAEWLFLDEDGDGFNWQRRDSVDYAYEGVGCITSASYDNNIGVLHPDNWALSPTQTVLNADAYFSFYIAPQDPNWPAEHIGVYIGSGTDTRDYVMIDEFTLESVDYVQMSYSLADYVGEDINVALRHFDCTDQFMVNVDMFVFVGVEEGEPLPKPDPEPELIDTIEILDFVEPAWGATAFLGVTVPDYANYSIDGAVWYGYNSQGSNTAYTFDNEEYNYYMFITIVPDEGYTLSNETAVTINGDTAFVDDYYNYWDENAGIFNVYTIDFNVEAPIEPIENINVVEIDEPEFGAAPDYEASVPEDAQYAIDSVEWFCDGELMNEGDLFDNEEAEYYAIITLTANEGYEFVEMPEVFVNDTEDFVVEYGSIEAGSMFIIMWGTFTVEREVIEEVGIEGFVEPVYGEEPFYDVTVPEGANYTIDNVVWMYYLDNGIYEMAKGDLFDNEEAEYFMQVTFLPNDGYKFAEELGYTVNGSGEYMDSYCLSEIEVADLYVGYFFVEAPEILWGDANGDGVVDLEDVLLLMRYVIDVDTVEEENLALCDVDGDGEVNLADALLIMRKVMGTIEAFPVEE